MLALEELSLHLETAQRFVSGVFSSKFSSHIYHYTIKPEDYRRSTPEERSFVKQYKLRLLAAFNNKCAICRRDDNDIDLDHCWLPKAAGGRFIMKRRNGQAVINAVPLCQKCNRTKKTKSPSEVWSQKQIKYIEQTLTKFSQVVDNVQEFV